ncbi:hypothetical protein J6590_074244 [Homalodisca vitripennis]|nr:hypothetical protein J6590_074244 [Homalodisca vitripennis]
MQMNNIYWNKKKIPSYIKAVNSLYMFNPNINEYQEQFTKRSDLKMPVFLTKHKLTFKPIIDENINAKKNTNRRVLEQQFKCLMSTYPKSCIIIYTDGSKTIKGTGAAIFVPPMIMLKNIP